MNCRKFEQKYPCISEKYRSIINSDNQLISCYYHAKLECSNTFFVPFVKAYQQILLRLSTITLICYCHLHHVRVKTEEFWPKHQPAQTVFCKLCKFETDVIQIADGRGMTTMSSMILHI